MAKWSTLFNLFGYAFIFMRKIAFSYIINIIFFWRNLPTESNFK